MKLSAKQKVGIGFYMAHSLLTKPQFFAYSPRKQSFIDDPYPVYRRMRDKKPAFWSPYTIGWHISGSHEFLLQCLKDERLSHCFRLWKFAPEYDASSPLDNLLSSLLMALPAKDHMRVRKLVSPAFSPRFVAEAKPEIEALVQEELKHFDRNGELDLVKLCREIPINAMAIYFRIPDAMRGDFNALGHAIIAAFSSEMDNMDTEAAERGIAQLRALFAEKRRNPDDSFMSTLINHMEDGDSMSENEALGLVGALLAAGVDTTFDYMLNIFYGLVKNPQWGPWLLENEDKLQNLMDETFRWNTFGNRGFFRFAVEDLEIHGQKIKKGEIVQIMFSIANHDPAVFPEPNTFNPLRENLDKAYTFGLGAHYCLGHAIAKLIAQVTVMAVVKRYPTMQSKTDPTREYNMLTRRINRMTLVKPQ
ncbi:MAG: cytochrome P450 [Pseudomonadales bacterium]